ncbi:MAG TPA: type II toxin-antitoxin system RelE/ParE family toxin [Tepidiformaceae bacterium]|nr:type II toxin-antitoxin system RelE/ParE family toxin [Tepidiformaceae bacterium]
MKVVLSPQALASLEAIRARLAEFSPASAARFVDAIEERLRQLEQYEFSGRVVPEYGVPLLRELVEPPYRIVYEVFPDRVEIVIVRHGREEFRRP